MGIKNRIVNGVDNQSMKRSGISMKTFLIKICCSCCFMTAVFSLPLSSATLAADGYYGNLGRTIEENAKKIAGELNTIQEEIIDLRNMQQPEIGEQKPAESAQQSGETPGTLHQNNSINPNQPVNLSDPKS
jgi:hypothetical protein